MSGGVDSSTAAAILKEKDYDILGITIYMYDNNLSKKNESPPNSGLKRFDDIKNLAKKLDIPHVVLDLRKDFKKSVIDYFSEEYMFGRTPNPCIKCNDLIKFNSIFHYLDKKKISHLATGHYARIVYDNSTEKYRLLRGLDRDKDQSYFLFNLG